MSVKSTEFHSLQSEYDTLSSTLKQLTNQKDVAQKRLDDLDVQVRNMDKKGQILGGVSTANYFRMEWKLMILKSIGYECRVSWLSSLVGIDHIIFYLISPL